MNPRLLGLAALVAFVVSTGMISMSGESLQGSVWTDWSSFFQNLLGQDEVETQNADVNDSIDSVNEPTDDVGVSTYDDTTCPADIVEMTDEEAEAKIEALENMLDTLPAPSADSDQMPVSPFGAHLVQPANPESATLCTSQYADLHLSGFGNPPVNWFQCPYVFPGNVFREFSDCMGNLCTPTTLFPSAGSPATVGCTCRTRGQFAAVIYAAIRQICGCRNPALPICSRGITNDCESSNGRPGQSFPQCPFHARCPALADGRAQHCAAEYDDPWNNNSRGRCKCMPDAVDADCRAKSPNQCGTGQCPLGYSCGSADGGCRCRPTTCGESSAPACGGSCPNAGNVPQICVKRKNENNCVCKPRVPCEPSGGRTGPIEIIGIFDNQSPETESSTGEGCFRFGYCANGRTCQTYTDNATWGGVRCGCQ